MHITNIVIDQHYNVFLMLDPGLRVTRSNMYNLGYYIKVNHLGIIQRLTI